ncbi:MAG: ATP-binding protein [Succinivibrio sp.]
MSDEEMLRSSNLILRDDYEQIEGVTYAGILLFGKDSTIMSILPQHKTDAIFRVVNVDRYDDRDVVITNLIESYDRLLAFGQKHLNDTFHLEGMQNVSARDHILREIISNLLVHRDFSSSYVPKLIIEKNNIITENGNLSHGYGALNPKSFEPVSKNPPIAKVFREIGLADELGSGMRNTYKYTKMYSGKEPVFVEGDVFRITVPLSDIATATVGPEGQNEGHFVPHEDQFEGQNVPQSVPHESPSDYVKDLIIKMITENPSITRKELGEKLGISYKTVGRKISEMKNVAYVGSSKTGRWVIDSKDK